MSDYEHKMKLIQELDTALAEPASPLVRGILALTRAMIEADIIDEQRREVDRFLQSTRKARPWWRFW